MTFPFLLCGKTSKMDLTFLLFCFLLPWCFGQRTMNLPSTFGPVETLGSYCDGCCFFLVFPQILTIFMVHFCYTSFLQMYSTHLYAFTFLVSLVGFWLPQALTDAEVGLWTHC